MTEPIDRASEPAPAASEPAPASRQTPAANPIISAVAALDPTSRLLVGGGIAAAATAVIGIPLDAWSLGTFSILVILAGLAAAGIAWWQAGGRLGPIPIPSRDLELAAAAIVGVLAAANLIEAAFDLDQIDERGGILGLLLTMLLVIAGIRLLLGATRRWSSGPVATLRASMGATIALVGVGLVLLGWTLNLSVGYWTTTGATVALTLVALAGAMIVATNDTSGLVRTSLAAGAAVVGLVMGVLALGQWADLAAFTDGRVDLGIVDIGAFLIYAMGIVALIGGAVLSAAATRTPGTADSTGSASA